MFGLAKCRQDIKVFFLDKQEENCREAKGKENDSKPANVT